AHLALLQRPVARHPRRHFYGRAVWIQSDPRGDGPATGPAGPEPIVVLRHRAARPCPTGEPADRRGARRLERRSRLAGPPPADRDRGPARRLLTSAVSGVMRYVAPHAAPLVEALILTAANLVATLFRYRLFRGWMASRLQVMTADGA